MSALEPSTEDEMPVLTPELALLRVLVEAHVATMPREKALEYLSLCVEILATKEASARVVSIRRRRNAPDTLRANRQALAAFRQILEGCVMRMGRGTALGEDDI